MECGAGELTMAEEDGYTLTEGSVKALAGVLGTMPRLVGGKLKTATMGPPRRRGSSAGSSSAIPLGTYQGQALVMDTDNGPWVPDFIRGHA
jgi:hypothetical protein